MHTTKGTKDYEALVAGYARQAGVKLEADRAYKLDVYLCKDHADVTITDIGSLVKTMRGDTDNYIKCIMDGVGLLPDWNDRQVVVLSAMKEWSGA